MISTFHHVVLTPDYLLITVVRPLPVYHPGSLMLALSDHQTSSWYWWVTRSILKKKVVRLVSLKLAIGLKHTTVSFSKPRPSRASPSPHPSYFSHVRSYCLSNLDVSTRTGPGAALAMANGHWSESPAGVAVVVAASKSQVAATLGVECLELWGFISFGESVADTSPPHSIFNASYLHLELSIYSLHLILQIQSSRWSANI